MASLGFGGNFSHCSLSIFPPSYRDQMNTIICSSLVYFIISRSECTNKGGTSAGSCANGFGVCCTCKYKQFSYWWNAAELNGMRVWFRSWGLGSIQPVWSSHLTTRKKIKSLVLNHSSMANLAIILHSNVSPQFIPTKNSKVSLSQN